MTRRWHTENWSQLMSGSDELLAEIRQHAALVGSPALDALVRRAEEQRSAAEATFQTLETQRQELLQTLDELQSELAIAGRPLTGEVS